MAGRATVMSEWTRDEEATLRRLWMISATVDSISQELRKSRGDTVLKAVDLELPQKVAGGRENFRPSTARVRQCMCCAGTFRSEGIHNRLCDRCRAAS